MLVDVHGHLSPSAPPARLTTYAGLCGLDFVLVSNRAAAALPPGAPDLDEAAANSACLQACRLHGRLVPLYWLRPGRPDSSLPAVAGALTTEPFVGAVFAPADGGYDLADHKLLAPYVDVLARTARPGLICIGAGEATAPVKAYDLARRFPRVPLVLCGCSAPESRRAEALDVVRRAAHRGDADLYLDTSHATGDAIRSAIYAAGAARLLFGSNALCYDDTHVPRHIAVLDELRKTLLPEEFRQVAGANAAALFRLRPPAAP